MNFHAKHVTGAKAVSPQTLIQLTFDNCAGDRQAAAKAVETAALHNPALTAHLISLGARTAVGNLIRSDRSGIFTGNAAADVTAPRHVRSKPDDSAHRRRVAGRAALEVRLLLDARLSNGKRMGDATKADVLAEVSVYQPQATDMMAKVNYFRLVATRLPDGKTVEQVLDNESLTALLAEARQQIPA